MYKGEGGKDSHSAVGMLGQLVGTSNKLEVAVGAPGIIVLDALPSRAHRQPLARVSIGRLVVHVPVRSVYHHSHHSSHPPFIAPVVRCTWSLNVAHYAPLRGPKRAGRG